jgi:hypothetical protein
MKTGFEVFEFLFKVALIWFVLHQVPDNMLIFVAIVLTILMSWDSLKVLVVRSLNNSLK